ncbi:hypothetical protein BaRGS_00034315 [Batillaria attramentaria]|uniref:Uncharacterized protein n=1 Tax=Batillaria attramentaria TaxID=370345 RepID=A0ABD0JHN5_9CAEN
MPAITLPAAYRSRSSNDLPDRAILWRLIAREKSLCRLLPMSNAATTTESVRMTREWALRELHARSRLGVVHISLKGRQHRVVSRLPRKSTLQLH